MKHKGQKKLQRQINKAVQQQNKALKNDEVFRGKYVIRQNRVIDYQQSKDDSHFNYLKVEDQIINTRTNNVVDNFTLQTYTGNYWLRYDLFRAINPIFCDLYDENRAEVYGK